MLHLKKIIGHTLDVLPDLVTMSRSMQKRPQNEHVKSALENAASLLWLFCDRRHSTLGLVPRVDVLPSGVKQEPQAHTCLSRRASQNYGQVKACHCRLSTMATPMWQEGSRYSNSHWMK